jgi:hypothetical protein
MSMQYNIQLKSDTCRNNTVSMSTQGLNSPACQVIIDCFSFLKKKKEIVSFILLPISV